MFRFSILDEHRLLHQVPPGEPETPRPEEKPVVPQENVDGKTQEELDEITKKANRDAATHEHLELAVTRRDAQHQQQETDHETDRIFQEMHDRPLAMIAALVLVLLRRIFTGQPTHGNSFNMYPGPYQPGHSMMYPRQQTFMMPGFMMQQPGMMMPGLMQQPAMYIYNGNGVPQMVPPTFKPPVVEKPGKQPEEKKSEGSKPPESKKPKEEEKPKEENPEDKEKPKDKPKEPEKEKPKDKPKEPEKEKPKDKPKEPEKEKPKDKPKEPEKEKPKDKPKEPEKEKPKDEKPKEKEPVKEKPKEKEPVKEKPKEKEPVKVKPLDKTPGPQDKLPNKGTLTRLESNKESKDWMAKQTEQAAYIDKSWSEFYRTNMSPFGPRMAEMFKIAMREQEKGNKPPDKNPSKENTPQNKNQQKEERPLGKIEKMENGTRIVFEELRSPENTGRLGYGFYYAFRITPPGQAQENWYLSTGTRVRPLNDLVLWRPEGEGDTRNYLTQTRFRWQDLLYNGIDSGEWRLPPDWGARLLRLRDRAIAAAESHRKDAAGIRRFDLGGRTPENTRSRPIGVLLFRDAGDDSESGKKDAKDFARNTGEFELLLRNMSRNGYNFVHGNRLDHVPDAKEENTPINLFRRSIEQMYQNGVRDFLMYGEAHGAGNAPELLFHAGNRQISLSLKTFMALTRENDRMRQCNFTMMLNSCFGGLRGANVPGESKGENPYNIAPFSLTSVMSDYEGAPNGRVTLMLMTTEYNVNVHNRDQTHYYITYLAAAQARGMGFGEAHMYAAERVQETTGIRPVAIRSRPGGYTRTAKGEEFKPGPDQA